MTIYGFDPSGNRFETFCGGLQSYPDQAPIAWSWDELPSGLDYPQRKLHETFLSVVT
jgi:catechol 2,3-dioxygenase